MNLLLRIPSVLGGAVVLLLSACIARRVSRDPWTPVVAAAFVAGVPGFVFDSAAVNNDNLVNVLGAALALTAVVFVSRAPNRTRDAWWLALLMGSLVGLLLLTKLDGAVLAPVVLVAVLFGARRSAVRFDCLLLASLASLTVTSWWLFRNFQLYGSPLPLGYAKSYLTGGHGGVLFGLGGPRDEDAFRILFVDVPKLLYSRFWYNSTWGRLPVWILLAVALMGLCFATERVPNRNAGHLGVLAACVIASLCALGLVALQTASYRAGYAYSALAALACLAALGLERLPIPIVARFAGPALGCVVTLFAIQHDLIAFYH